MKAWYESLTNSQQIWTWILFVLCGIGIIRLLWLCFRSWILDIVFINKYLRNAQSLVLKYRNYGDNSIERAYLIRMGEEVSDIIGYDRLSYPEKDLVKAIKNKYPYTPEKLEHIVELMHASFLEWDQKRKSKRWSYIFQLIFPLLFWVFQGIEVILILISNCFDELGWSFNNDEDRRLVKILSTIFTIITGLASLFSYLHIELW